MKDSLRLDSHPVLNHSIENRRTVTIMVDGKPVIAMEGETLAATLWAGGYIALGRNPSTGHKRGMYCGIGHCYECRVTVDGIADIRSCLIPVKEGMRVQLEKRS